MAILAIETASSACSVALIVDGGIIELEEKSLHSHTKSILPMVDKLLSDAGIKLNQLEAIAFDAGPGSFTGLRIGAGVAQGLAFAHDLPVIKISSLSAMAAFANVRHSVVALDARMQEVYFAKFKKEGDEFIILGEIKLLKPETVELEDSNWTLVGNGWAEYQSDFKSGLLAGFAQKFEVMPHAREIAKLASKKDVEKLPVEMALPVYLRVAVSAKRKS